MTKSKSFGKHTLHQGGIKSMILGPSLQGLISSKYIILVIYSFGLGFTNCLNKSNVSQEFAYFINTPAFEKA